MKKLNSKDLEFKTRTIANLSKGNLTTANENNETVTDCPGRTQGNECDTRVTCANTVIEDCDTSTFASECICSKECATSECQSNICTKSEGIVCCDKTHEANCPIPLTINNCSESKEFCHLTSNCLYTESCPELTETCVN